MYTVDTRNNYDSFYVNIVKFLLKNKFDPNYESKIFYSTPLIFAI